jgi:uncharacterized protein (TIRG00374 family)
MIAYLYLQRESIKALTTIDPWMALAIIVAAIGTTTVQSLQFKAAVSIQKYKVSLGESIALTAANTMANYYLPVRGGMVVRAAYMNRVHQMPLPEYAALSVLLTAWSIVVAAVLGILGLVALLGNGTAVSTQALFTLVGVGAAAIAATAVAIWISSRITSNGRFAAVLRGFRSGASLWFSSTPLLLVFVSWTVLLFCAQAVRLWLSFRAIGVDLDVGSIFVIQAMAAVAFVLALTPGNIGVKEGAIVFAASVLGIDPSLALLASLIDRAAALIVTFTIGVGTASYLGRRATATRNGSPPQSDGT